MKATKSIPLSIFFTFFTVFIFSQNLPVLDSIARTSKFSPEGFFDSIFDGRGNKLSLNDIRVDKTENDGVTLKSSPLCVQGLSYFNLYFESGSGMELNNALHNARRNVVCKVFEDISNFINSPLTTTGQKINFWFRDQNMISPNDLVYASSFYSLPTGFQNDGIILDNEIWKTINSGVDSYATYLQPFGYYPPLSTNGNNGLFYHGYMVLNFNGIGSNTWNYNLSNVNISNTEFDLYTIVFNKVLHALGINSLIYFDGSSIVVGMNYFTRYDTFLMDNSETNHLISNNQGCSMTEYSFNTLVPLTAISNGCTTSSFSDYTDCQNAVKYVGTSTIPVYTPTCWEFDLSLSHFEDLCLPNQGSQINDTYYAKSNFFHPGANYVKRYMKPEERTVLCDLGYSVNNTYGSVANNNFYSYNTNCTSSSIVGLTDGITNNIYTNQATINNVYALNGSSFLSNDVNNTTSALNFECLQDLSYPTTLFSTTNGNSATNVNITFYEEGIHLLRYVPTNSSGTKGNVTYIYFYVSSNGCTSCNYVKNGAFNNGTWGPIANNLTLITVPLGKVDCWQYMSNSPDVVFYTPYNNTLSIVPGITDQWDNSSQPSFLGLCHENLSTYSFSPNLTDSIFSYSESVQSRLNTTIQPNTNYTLSFRARLNPTNSNTSLSNHALTFTFSSDPVIFPYYLPINANSSLPAVLPSNLESFFSPITIINNSNTNNNINSNTNNWNFYTLSFNSSSTTGLKFIEIINNSTIKSYIQVDNVELNKTADLPTLNLPSTLCYNQQIDLLDYLSNQNLNGVFYLDNSPTPLSSSIFDPSLYPAGMHQIIYTYVLNGCTYTVQDNVYINNATINVTIQASATTICNGASIQLTANGAQNYTWQPGNINGNMQPITITPSVSGNYTVTGTSNGCTSTATIPIVVANCNACTSNCTNYLGVSGIISQNDVLPNTEYCINNDVVINGSVTFNHNLVKIAPNVKITVPYNSLLTIKGSHFFACNDMWQGIVVDERGRVRIENSISSNGINFTTLIEDAKIAIEFKQINLSQATPVLAVENATFNKNDIGIKINSYQFSNVSTIFTIKNSIFTCRDLFQTGYPAAWVSTYSLKALNPLATSSLNPPYIHPNYNKNIFLKPPFNNQRSSCGIYLENVGTNNNNTYNCFKIGLENVATEFNLFDNIKIGIEGLNANVEVVNSVFQHHFKSEKSVFVTNTNTNLKRSLFVGGSLQKKCGFYNANFAIHAIKYQQTQISHNTFRSDKRVQYVINSIPNSLMQMINDPSIMGKNGIYLSIANMYQTKIENNTFYNIQSCIYGNIGSSSINQSTIPGIVITQNNFDLDLTNTYTGIDRYINFAILFEGNLKPAPPLYIYNNLMKDVFNGIKLINLEQASKIYNNTINLKANFNYTQLRSGISVDNLTPLNSREIRSNIITGSGIAPNQKSVGISANNTRKLLIECNAINNTFYGLYFKNTCTNGTDTKIYKNDLSNHKYGLTLDYYGVIGQQGNTSNPSDNRWLGNNWSPSNAATGNFKTFCTNSSFALLSPLYVRSSSNVFNPNDSYTFNSSISSFFSTTSNPQTLFPLNYASAYTNCPNFTVSFIDPISYNVELNSTYTHLWKNLVNKVVDLDSSFNFSNDDNIKIYETYQLLDEHPNLIDSSNILRAFYMDYSSTTSGKIQKVNHLYENGNFNQMSLQLANINPSNLVEANFKRYYQIVFAFENGNATPQDSFNLRSIANSCPEIEGPAVYLARSFYNHRFASNMLFEGNCEVNANKQLLLPTPNTTKHLSAYVYPNPNSGYMNIQLSDNSIESIIVNVFSVDGKLVHHGDYILNNGNFVLDLKLNIGSYHLVLEQLTTNETIHQQLIIHE